MSKWNSKKGMFEEVQKPKAKKKSKIKKKVHTKVKEIKEVRSFIGIIDSNWSNIVSILQQNKIKYTADPDYFIISDGKKMSAIDAKKLIDSEMSGLVKWL